MPRQRSANTSRPRGRFCLTIHPSDLVADPVRPMYLSIHFLWNGGLWIGWLAGDGGLLVTEHLEEVGALFLLCFCSRLLQPDRPKLVHVFWPVLISAAEVLLVTAGASSIDYYESAIHTFLRDFADLLWRIGERLLLSSFRKEDNSYNEPEVIEIAKGQQGLAWRHRVGKTFIPEWKDGKHGSC
ncbi:unnamed protein product [Calypogeia fissa]